VSVSVPVCVTGSSGTVGGSCERTTSWTQFGRDRDHDRGYGSILRLDLSGQMSGLQLSSEATYKGVIYRTLNSELER